MGDYKSRKYVFYRKEPLNVPRNRKIGNLNIYQADKNIVIVYNQNNSIQFDIWDSAQKPGVIDKMQMFISYLFSIDELDWNRLFYLSRIAGVSSRGCDRPRGVK